MGSVKDLKVITAAITDKCGLGLFTFSDRYSVFDWGEMPDMIKDKGTALCIIGAYLCEELEKQGIGTHYLGLLEDGQSKKLADMKGPSNQMQVRLLNVVKLPITGDTYDYSAYHEGMKNYLIPLEIIYRNSLPEGASVFKRLQNGSLTLEDIGLKEMPLPGMKLDPPLFDVSTKLEATDRYINWNEAQKISGLDNIQMKQLQDKLLFLDKMITAMVAKLGLINEDGKFEFGIDDNKRMIVVDVLGTPDECRFTYDSIPVSKEIARIWYRKSEWYIKVEEAKKKEKIEWKKYVDKGPDLLPPRLAELISSLYLAFCNELTGRQWFEAPALKSILAELKTFIK